MIKGRKKKLSSLVSKHINRNIVTIISLPHDSSIATLIFTATEQSAVQDNISLTVQCTAVQQCNVTASITIMNTIRRQHHHHHHHLCYQISAIISSACRMLSYYNATITSSASMCSHSEKIVFRIEEPEMIF